MIVMDVKGEKLEGMFYEHCLRLTSVARNSPKVSHILLNKVTWNLSGTTAILHQTPVSF